MPSLPRAARNRTTAPARRRRLRASRPTAPAAAPPSIETLALGCPGIGLSGGNRYHRGARGVNRAATLFRTQMTPFETIEIDEMVAACNGGGGPLGHPRVYLNL